MYQIIAQSRWKCYSTVKKRNTSWRLNNSILNGKMKEDMRAEIKKYVEENDNGEVSPSILWDACKAVLRGKIIAKTTALKKSKQEELIDLEAKLKELQRKHKLTLDANLEKEMHQIKTKLNDNQSRDILKSLMFVKQKYYEVGSKSTKLLAYKIKKQQTERTIYKIRDSRDGNIKYDLNDISQSFEIYYKKLYTQPSLDNKYLRDSLLEGLKRPTVSEAQNKSLCAPITEEELNGAISNLKSNKSPGLDGYTSEWYKALREPLTPQLLGTFSWVLRGGVNCSHYSYGERQSLQLSPSREKIGWTVRIIDL